jgi:hypothetical protein
MTTSHDEPRLPTCVNDARTLAPGRRVDTRSFFRRRRQPEVLGDR